jgi:hypothetical protein
VCQGDGRVKVYQDEIECRVCGGTGRDYWEPRPCSKCYGFGKIYRGPIELFYISGQSPYRDRRTIEDILHEVTGKVLVVETWFGKGTLDLLKSISDKCTVRVLISHMEEKQKVSADDILRYRKERPSFEFKRAGQKQVHDRYIIDNRGLTILGHGLKNIGTSQSFAVFLERSLISDVIEQIAKDFDSKWNSATSL